MKTNVLPKLPERFKDKDKKLILSDPLVTYEDVLKIYDIPEYLVGSDESYDGATMFIEMQNQYFVEYASLFSSYSTTMLYYLQLLASVHMMGCYESPTLKYEKGFVKTKLMLTEGWGQTPAGKMLIAFDRLGIFTNSGKPRALVGGTRTSYFCPYLQGIELQLGDPLVTAAQVALIYKIPAYLAGADNSYGGADVFIEMQNQYFVEYAQAFSVYSTSMLFYMQLLASAHIMFCYQQATEIYQNMQVKLMLSEGWGQSQYGKMLIAFDRYGIFTNSGKPRALVGGVPTGWCNGWRYGY